MIWQMIVTSWWHWQCLHSEMLDRLNLTCGLMRLLEQRLMSRDWPEIHEQQWVALMMGRWAWDSWQQETSDWWVDVIISFDCKCKFVLHLRLRYLKPFLAGSKKTRQGLGCRVGALCISRCWFCLTVVAEPKLIQKDYQIIWCCVLLCYGSWWVKCYDMWMMKFMKRLWDW